MDKLTQFFYDNAGYSYDPKLESQEQGKIRCAIFLANATKWAFKEGISFQWDVDQDSDSTHFSNETPAWPLYQCSMYGPE